MDSIKNHLMMFDNDGLKPLAYRDEEQENPAYGSPLDAKL